VAELKVQEFTVNTCTKLACRPALELLPVMMTLGKFCLEFRN